MAASPDACAARVHSYKVQGWVHGDWGPIMLGYGIGISFVLLFTRVYLRVKAEAAAKRQRAKVCLSVVALLALRGAAFRSRVVIPYADGCAHVDAHTLCCVCSRAERAKLKQQTREGRRRRRADLTVGVADYRQWQQCHSAAQAPLAPSIDGLR